MPAPDTGNVAITRIRETAPTDRRADLDRFVLDVPIPADTGTGECTDRLAPDGSGNRVIAVYYPDLANAVAAAVVTLDPNGRIVAYNDRRGGVKVKGIPGASRAVRDSVFAAARQATRSTTIALQYRDGMAFVSNDGGGRPTEAIAVPLREAAAHPKLLFPDRRAHEILARCGVTPTR